MTRERENFAGRQLSIVHRDVSPGGNFQLRTLDGRRRDRKVGMEPDAEGNWNLVAVSDGRRDGQTERAEMVGDADLTQEGEIWGWMEQEREDAAVLIDGFDSKGSPSNQTVGGGGVFDVIDRGPSDASGERPLAVADAIGPGEEYLAARVSGNFFAREALDDTDTTLYKSAKRRAHFSDDGTLITVRDRDLFTRGQHQLVCFLFTGT